MENLECESWNLQEKRCDQSVKSKIVERRIYKTVNVKDKIYSDAYFHRILIFTRK